jgi:hypothetical protein
MYCNGHTLDTMFATKLVACKARYDKNGKNSQEEILRYLSILFTGDRYNKGVIEDRTSMKYTEYLSL